MMRGYPSFLADVSNDGVRTGIITGVASYFFTIGGFLLALLLIARLMKEKRQPSNTLTWLMMIVLIPYAGVPLYLIFGGRKLRRLAADKNRLYAPPEIKDTIRFPEWPNGHPLFQAASLPPSSGNSMEFLLTGEEAFRTLEKHILSAKHTIHIMAFILGRDEVGRRLVALLAKKAAEGVKVRLLLDALGCFKTRGGFVDPLRRAGGEIARFMPVLPIQTRWSANLRNHRKIAVFDHETAIVGGHNLGRQYMGPTPWEKRFHDFGAVLRGPAVEELHRIFLADWNFATRKHANPLDLPEGRPISSSRSGIVQVIASGPDVANDPLYEAILLLVQEARETITIVTPYFIPDEVLFRSLIIKLHSGKKVTIIVPLHSNHPMTDLARAHYLRELRAAGARVLTFLPGMLHAKAILVDDRVAMFGSVNIDLRSLFVNFEIGLFSYSRKDVAKIALWAGRLEDQSEEFEHNRVKPPGFARTLAEDMSRLFAPLL